MMAQAGADSSFAMIGAVSKDRTQASASAAWRDGVWKENFMYALKCTPCRGPVRG